MPRASVLKAGGWYARNGGPGTHVSARQEADTAARVAQLARREVGEEALGAPLEEANPQRDERHHSVRRDHHHVTAPVSRQTVRRAPRGFRPTPPLNIIIRFNIGAASELPRKAGDFAVVW